MTLPLWGQLEKSQDDNETIEEAIARLIAEHESDPEAHLGEGESLEAHKTEEVVDHPPFSLVPDKYSPVIPDSDSWFTDFRLIAPFLVINDVTANTKFISQLLQTLSTTGSKGGFATFDEGDFFFDSGSWVVRFDFWTSILNGSNKDILFGVNVAELGFIDPGDGPYGFGFRFPTDGKVYAVWQDLGDPLSSVEITGINIGFPHKYTAIFTNEEQILFFVDDVLKVTATVGLPNFLLPDSNFGIFMHKVSSGQVARLSAYHLLLTREPLP